MLRKKREVPNIQSLRPEHERSAFCSGVEPLDRYIKELASQDQVASSAVVVNVLQVEPDPLPFYLRYDFEPLPEQPRCLVLPLQRYHE